MDEMKINPVELEKSLKGADYPADKESLLATARRNNADHEVVEFLERIPDQSYDTPAEITRQMGEGTSDRNDDTA